MGGQLVAHLRVVADRDIDHDDRWHVVQLAGQPHVTAVLPSSSPRAAIADGGGSGVCNAYPVRVRAQRLPRQARREQILDVAMEMFATDGFAGTSISEVERRVGFKAGTGSFYRHFSSKEQLLEAAVEREVSRCVAHIEQEWAELQMPEDPELAMKATAKQMLRDIAQFDRLARLVLAEGDRVPTLRRWFIEALQQTQALGPWVDDASRLVGIAALVGFHQFRLAGGGRVQAVSDDQFVDTLVALLPVQGPEVPRRGARRLRRDTTAVPKRGRR